MQLPRRTFLHLAASAAALPAIAGRARAQAYPTRPVRFVVTFPAGGANDIHARMIGQWLTERLGQSFVIENRPGGAGNLGVEAVVRAPADGHTIVMLSISHAVNRAIYQKISYDLVRDIVPAAALYRAQYLMLVSPTFPAKTVPEFIAYAKANPGKINFGSNGLGATGHLAGELFMMMTGTSMQHVPYRGEAPALTDLVGGQTHVQFATMTGGMEFIRGGQLRALAVTSKVRSPALPDVPPLNDFVPGYEILTWVGIGVPRNTPAAIVDRLNAEINAALTTPSFQSRYAELGVTPYVASPGEFAKLIADDIDKWAKIVKFAGIKPI